MTFYYNYCCLAATPTFVLSNWKTIHFIRLIENKLCVYTIWPSSTTITTTDPPPCLTILLNCIWSAADTPTPPTIGFGCAKTQLKTHKYRFEYEYKIFVSFIHFFPAAAARSHLMHFSWRCIHRDGCEIELHRHSQIQIAYFINSELDWTIARKKKSIAHSQTTLYAFDEDAYCCNCERQQ